MRSCWVMLAMLACSAAEQPQPSAPAPVAGPVADVVLGGDWVIVEEDASSLVLRLGKSADGVRITTAASGGRAVGVAPIIGGRTLEMQVDGVVVPVFAWPWPEHPLTAVRLEVQGPDLLVQLAGPPIRELTDHPDAPDDPALSWIRIRPRGDTWRLALRGVHRWSLPGPVRTKHQGRTRTVRSSWGSFTVDSDAVATQSTAGPLRWTWDSREGLDHAHPYPKTGITWTPIP